MHELEISSQALYLWHVSQDGKGMNANIYGTLLDLSQVVGMPEDTEPSHVSGSMGLMLLHEPTCL